MWQGLGWRELGSGAAFSRGTGSVEGAVMSEVALKPGGRRKLCGLVRCGNTMLSPLLATRGYGQKAALEAVMQTDSCRERATRRLGFCLPLSWAGRNGQMRRAWLVGKPPTIGCSGGGPSFLGRVSGKQEALTQGFCLPVQGRSFRKAGAWRNTSTS